MNRHTKSWKRLIPSRRWLILPPIAVGVLVLAGSAMSKKGLPRLELTEQAVQLQVVRIEPRTVRPTVVGYGTAQPQREWTAIAEVSGQIVETHPDLDSGKTIGADQLLFRIDDSDYQLQLDQRKADHARAMARVAELKASEVADRTSLEVAEALLVVTQRGRERMLELRQGDVVTEGELDEAEGNVLRQIQAVQILKKSLSLYESKLAAAEAGVAMLKSQVDEARRNVDRTVIRSPFGGVLADVTLETGQVVGVGERLFQLQDNVQIEIEAHISLAQVDRLVPRLESHEGYRTSRISDADMLKSLSATVSSRSGNLTNSWRGIPVRISASVDRQTRTLGIVIRVDNIATNRDRYTSPENKPVETSQIGLTSQSQYQNRVNGQLHSAKPLRSGTYCEITLFGVPFENAIVLPRTAFDGDDVYVIDSANRVHRREVQRGFPVEDRIVIASGLEPGEVVAVKPPVPAIDGMLVKPRKSSLIAPRSLWSPSCPGESTVRRR